MKNFHQNLLIVLALALCGLCAFQWYDQSLQRNKIENLGQVLSAKLAAIQDYTNSMHLMDGQIAQLGGQITGLKGTIQTNDDLILNQKRELNRVEAENEALTNEVVQYQDALKAYHAKLDEAAEAVKKQNVVIKDLVTQRDGFVDKLNDSIKDRNNIVAKYNELAAQVEKIQNAKPQDK
jgi:predicted RNase H-like nuclease (RuvC/YqgF family)